MADKDNQFMRKMSSKHLVTLSLGGVIGTGIFLSSGYLIQEAGAIGTIIAYVVGGVSCDTGDDVFGGIISLSPKYCLTPSLCLKVYPS